MLSVVDLAIDVSLAAEIGLGLIQVPLLQRDFPQLTESRRDAWMHLTVSSLQNSQRVPQHGNSVACFSLSDQRPADDGHDRRRLRMILSVKALQNVQRFAIKALGVRVVPLLRLDGSQIEQILRHIGMAIAVKLPVHSEDALVQ